MGNLWESAVWTQYMVEPVSTHVKSAKGQNYYLYVQNINKLKYHLVYVKIEIGYEIRQFLTI